MKTVFKNRSVPGLVIALYDYLRLWSLPSRQQKMRELMQAQQNTPISQNNYMQSSQYPPQPQMQTNHGSMPIHYSNQMNPYNVPMNRMPENQAAGMSLQPYPNPPRGRGRPPKNTKINPQQQQPPIPHQPTQIKTKEEK